MTRVPDLLEPEHASTDPPLAGLAAAPEEMQFVEKLENSEGETDLDAMRINDLAVEFVRRSFANQQLVDFGT